VTLDLPTGKGDTIRDMFSYRSVTQGKRKSKDQQNIKRRRRRRRDPVTGELMPLPELPPAQEGESEGEGNEENAENQNDNDNDNDEATALDPELATPAAQAAEGAGPAQEEEDEEAEPARVVDDSTMQILDLHSDNPLISFRDKVYSCQWSSALGSDMFLAKHNEAGDGPVLRQLGSFDLLGMSAARLTASRAKMVYRSSG
jgi:hypothetical protein